MHYLPICFSFISWKLMLTSQGHLKAAFKSFSQYMYKSICFSCFLLHTVYRSLNTSYSNTLTLLALFLYDVSRISVCVCVSLPSVSLSQIRSQGGRWRGNRKEGLLWQQQRKRIERLRRQTETEKVIKDLSLVFTSIFSMRAYREGEGPKLGEKKKSTNK